MEQELLLSLCIPTNGVIEWVFPVLDSIFKQDVENKLFEVVIADNGNNREFEKKLKEYIKKHANIIYVKTDAKPFLNEIESYRKAKGRLIKFINHRTMLVEGALKKLINFAHDNMKERPIAYFSNGVLQKEKKQYWYTDFDSFVRNLSYWSSWSTGMAIWKEDFEKIPEDTEYNELFPHTTILFRENQRCRYVIDNTVIMNELPTGKIAKGNYDLFYAFGVEYPDIILGLFRAGYITRKTFLKVKSDNLGFIALLYLNFCVRKQTCSYDLGGFEECIQVFYSKKGVRKVLLCKIVDKIIRKAGIIRGGVQRLDDRVLPLLTHISFLKGECVACG